MPRRYPALKKKEPSEAKKRGADRLKPHRWTSETARAAQLKSAAARKANARAVRERLGKMAEKELEAIFDAYRRGYTAPTADAYRAGDALLTQAFGRPLSEIELSTGVEGNVTITLESAFDLSEPSLPAPADIELEPVKEEEAPDNSV
jgi:hypothetical protein